MNPFYLGTFGLSLFLSFLLTRSVRGWCTSRGWVSSPDRYLHVVALPQLGGLAIYISFVLSVGIGLLANVRFWGLMVAPSLRPLLTILISGTLILALGVYRDVRSTSQYTKFGVQAIAAAILFAGGLRILDLPLLFGAHHLGWAAGLLLTMVWVIGITNAFNLIDGLDGLAAGSALFSTFVVFAVALYSHAALVTLLTIALAGAILGFLRFNFNPATICLGDCGSMFIGFMLSALALLGAQKSPTAIAVAIPVVSFGLPIVNTVLSVLRRWISGEPLFSGDDDHVYHKLLKRGLSQRQVVTVLYAVSAVFALLSLSLLLPTGATLAMVLAVVGIGICFGVQQLGYLEFGEIQRVAQRTIEQRRVVLNSLSFRRAAEELKGARDYNQVCGILEAAFSGNEFDGFDLELIPNDGTSRNWRGPSSFANTVYFKWPKPSGARLPVGSVWSLTLHLVTTANQRRGLMKIYRRYEKGTLLLDINFLTSVFPMVLADALDRTGCSAEPLLDTTTAKKCGFGETG